jgi:hypothetical protein
VSLINPNFRWVLQQGFEEYFPSATEWSRFRLETTPGDRLKQIGQVRMWVRPGPGKTHDRERSTGGLGDWYRDQPGLP